MRIVFEGLPGAGKTTASTKLAEILDCPLVQEFGGLSFEYWTKYRLKIPFYRVNDELKEYIGSKFIDDVVIFDRHYVGTLAYAFALSEVDKIPCSAGECYSEELSWYRQSIEKRLLTPPDISIILNITPQVSISRKPSATANDPVWGRLECLEAMRDYYSNFYRFVEPTTSFLLIDAEPAFDLVFGELSKALAQHLATTNSDLSTQLLQAISEL